MADPAKYGDIASQSATDEELIQRVGRGDESAFRELLSQYQKPALRAAYRFLGNAEEAEDIAQETFLRVYRNANQFKPIASFKTWFYIILSNLCRDALKKKRPLYQADLPEDSALGTDHPGIALERAERSRVIHRAILRLPPHQRLALILRYWEGLTQAETATSLELSIKAVESLLARARKTLKRELAEVIDNFRE